MRNLLNCLGGAAVAGFVFLALVVGSSAENVPTDKVPKKVMDAVKARFPGGQISSVQKELEQGAVVYDIELKHKGRKYEMDIKEDGTVLEVEKEVAAADLPKVVRDAVNAKYPKAKLKDIMEVNKVKDNKETPDHYEIIVVTAAGTDQEILVSLDGKKITVEKAEKK